MKIILNALVLCLLTIVLTSCSADASAPDWNDEDLNWHNYKEGVAELKKTRKNGIFILYADWCPTCKKYSKLFSNSDVVEALEDVVLIRTNIDEEPDISEKFNIDGDYVPRTFALNRGGRIIKNLIPENSNYQFFLPANDKDFLIEIAELVTNHGAK